jgi:hypothetical protein
MSSPSARLRSEASTKAAPLRERALTALADTVAAHLSPEQVLRRARFVEPVGGETPTVACWPNRSSI